MSSFGTPTRGKRRDQGEEVLPLIVNSAHGHNSSSMAPIISSLTAATASSSQQPLAQHHQQLYTNNNNATSNIIYNNNTSASAALSSNNDFFVQNINFSPRQVALIIVWFLICNLLSPASCVAIVRSWSSTSAASPSPPSPSLFAQFTPGQWVSLALSFQPLITLLLFLGIPQARDFVSYRLLYRFSGIKKVLVVCILLLFNVIYVISISIECHECALFRALKFSSCFHTKNFFCFYYK